MVNLVAVIRTSIILAPLWFALLSCGNEEGGVSSNLNTASGLDQSPSAEAGNSNLPNVPTDGPLSSLIQNYLISVAYDIDKAIVEVSNFQNQVTADGKRWPKLKKSTIAQKKKLGKTTPLVGKTSNLQKDAEITKTTSDLVIVEQTSSFSKGKKGNFPYGWWQNEGRAEHGLTPFAWFSLGKNFLKLMDKTLLSWLNKKALK